MRIRSRRRRQKKNIKWENGKKKEKIRKNGGVKTKEKETYKTKKLKQT
jgi:hypothetical protein